MKRVMIHSDEFPKLRKWAREEHDTYGFFNACNKAGFKTVKYEPNAYVSDYCRYSISAEEYTWFMMRWS
jgi:hypothetical protein